MIADRVGRFGKSEQAVRRGNFWGLPVNFMLFALVTVIVTASTVVVFGEALLDPIKVVERIQNTPMLVLGCVTLLVATIGINIVANFVSAAYDIANVAPRHISFARGGLITAVVGILMLPWKLYSDAGAYIFTWLIGYSSLMGALGGILIADYWVIRKQQLSLPDLFKVKGRYTYDGGFNRKAMIALVVAVLPVLPGFLHAAATPGGNVPNPGFLDHLYQYAWFVTFFLSFVIYLVLMRGETASLYDDRRDWDTRVGRA
jgi:NCS1 family nucleobase:cation symporter-1